MKDVRKVLTEQEAASYFVRDVTIQIKDAWPTIRKEVRDISIHLYSDELVFLRRRKGSVGFYSCRISARLGSCDKSL